MTTADPFTEAARAEGHRRAARACLGGNSATTDAQSAAYAWEARLFEQAAEWARTHLAQQNPLTEAIRAVATTTTLTGQDVAGIAQSLQRITQEPTDAEVEAVAVLLYRQRALHHTMESWGREPEPIKNRHRLDARAALVTARDARAARRDEERRASCGCDLTGPVPPAVHIVDRHEVRR